jgi:hypothetical protein
MSRRYFGEAQAEAPRLKLQRAALERSLYRLAKGVDDVPFFRQLLPEASKEGAREGAEVPPGMIPESFSAR